MKWTLESVLAANMNMIRIWGGGRYLPDIFYKMADEMGIMIWQEFPFACSLYPTNKEFLAEVYEEISQQVRRLNHHPSIMMWSGNSENESALKWYEASKLNRDLYVVDY